MADKVYHSSQESHRLDVVALTTTGSLKVTVTEKGSTTPVDGVTVQISTSDGKTTSVTTDSTGTATANNLPAGNYTAQITGGTDGYEANTTVNNGSIEAGKNAETAFELEKTQSTQPEPNPEPATGSLTITVIDERSGEEVPRAKVEVKNEAGTVVATGTTNEDGVVSVPNLPAGKYTVTITEVPGDYTVTTDKEITQEVKVNEESKCVYKVDKLGNLTILVTDERTGKEVSGAEVEVKNEAEAVVATGTTNQDGMVSVSKLPIGKYTVTVTKAPGEYTVTTNKEITQEVVANKTTNYEYKVDKLGSLTIIVTDERSGEEVSGAEVEVKNEAGTVVATGTTNEDGFVSVHKLPTGKYTVTITEVPDNYTVTTNKEITQEVVANKTTNYEYKVDKLGSVTITVKDDNGTNIQGAEVIITYPDGTTQEQVVTDSEGKVKLDKVPEGEYKVTISKIPEGYTVTTDKEFTKEVVANKDTVYEFEIDTQEAVGHLSVVVTDERTGAKVSNAKVTIAGPDSYSKQVTTDINGAIMLNGLKVGKYTVTVTEVPDNYTVTTDKVIEQEVVAGKVTAYEYKVDKLGTVNVTVTDEKTGAKVSNAKVEIKNEAGKVVASGTTDKDGKVSVAGLPTGKYTVTTDKEIKQEVAANKTTEYDFKLDKDSSTGSNNGNNNSSNNNSSNNNNSNNNNSSNNNNTATNNTPAPTTAPAGSEVAGIAKAHKTGEEATLYVVLAMMMFAGMGCFTVMSDKKRSQK